MTTPGFVLLGAARRPRINCCDKSLEMKVYLLSLLWVRRQNKPWPGGGALVSCGFHLQVMDGGIIGSAADRGVWHLRLCCRRKSGNARENALFRQSIREFREPREHGSFTKTTKLLSFYLREAVWTHDRILSCVRPELGFVESRCPTLKEGDGAAITARVH